MTMNMIGVILYRDGVIVDLSEETAAIFGYTRAELIGAPLSKLTECGGSMVVAGDGSEKRNRSVGSRCLGRRKDGAVVELEFLGCCSWINEFAASKTSGAAGGH